MSLGLRHVEKRKKARLSGFPTRSSVLKNALDILIYPLAIGGPLAMLPQVIQLYSERNASGLALPTWVLFLCFNAVWCMYGIVHKDRPIILTNMVLAALNFSVVAGILLFS
jgi:uncharacterized protein with PQ loop repeat